MKTTSHQVLKLLSSGEFLSGEIIGQQLGISRMAVSKAVKRLGACDVPISSVTGKGYRLQRSIQLLDRQLIDSLLKQGCPDNFKLHILETTSSTSDFLLDLERTVATPGSVCLSEKQDAGRGRRERSWISTPYRNITMSIIWQFDNGMAGLAGLSVAAGITIVKVLHDFGLDADIGLKWPNDIVWRDRKLGGLLMDVRGEHDGPCTAVLGLGLNLSLSESDAGAIDQPFTTLEAIHDAQVDRNALVASLIDRLMNTFEDYPASGFLPWHDQWQYYDRLAHRPVVVIRGGERLHGTALGINEQGALCVQLDTGEKQNFFSGEVSLRLQ